MFAAYYRRVLVEAKERTVVFARSQGLVTGIVLAVLGVACGIWMEYRRHSSGSATMKDIHELLLTAIISGVAPIMVLGLASFLFFLVRAPAVLAQREQYAFDRLQHSKAALVQQHAQLVAELTDQIEELQNRLGARDPALHFKIEWWGQLMMLLGAREGYGSNHSS
jgi:hypothetical protein